MTSQNRLIETLLPLLLFGIFGLGSAVTAQSVVPFSRMTVFGDSLSDVGNADRSTFGLVPGDDYFDGRFSNGLLYVDHLAEKLELPPLRPRLAGGTNYAYGGARTSGTSFFDGGFFIDDLDEQVDDYLSDQQPAEDELLVVLAGGNDFVLADASNGAAIARRVVRQIDRLVDAGARQILSINLPPLGDTPRGRSSRELWNARSQAYNNELAVGLSEFDVPDLTIYEMDLGELFSVLLENLDDFGFTNATEAGMNVADPVGYVFWDELHPTTAAHQLLGEAAYRQLQRLPAYGGDFNFDGTVDAVDVDMLGRQLAGGTQRLSFDVSQDGMLSQADLVELLQVNERSNGDADFNGEVGFGDFLILSANFGLTGPEARWSAGDFDANGEVGFPDFLILSRNFETSIAVVPEPNTLTFWVVIGLSCGGLRPRRSWKK